MTAVLHLWAETCQSCGTREDEWLDADGHPKRDPPYTPTARKCFGCEAIERRRSEVPAKAKGIWLSLRRVLRR